MCCRRRRVRVMARLAGLRRSFPTFFQFIEPIRRLRESPRRLWPYLLVPLAIIPATWIWWATQLWGLPDIGDPFDVGAFQTQTSPEERNAFVLYRESADKRVPPIAADGTRGLFPGNDAQWSRAS